MKVSPKPTRPSLVWAGRKIRLPNSSSQMVSSAMIFMSRVPPKREDSGSVLSQELPNGPANDLQMGAHRIVPGIVNADDPQVRCI